MVRFLAQGTPDPGLALLHRTVPLALVLRIAAGLVVLLGGIAFVAIGPLLFSSIAWLPVPHPFGLAVFALGTIAMGCLFVHIGWRVLTARSRRETIGPRARRAFGLLLAAAAVGTMLHAWTDDSVAFAAQAIGMGFFAFLMFRSAAGR